MVNKSKIDSSPDWMDGLILYEIVPEQFTEEGTFTGIQRKLSYLSDLGVTGIWLTPIHPNKRHFYNIDTGYACVDPSKINPEYGSPSDFKNLVSKAHEYGTKVFLDVITHGVTKDSPLIEAHPDWFKGEGTEGSWRMIDYDWKGDHENLEEWWVSIWTDYVLDYGVDGFRLDVDPYRKDLWEKIKLNCAKKGKNIAIMPERVLCDIKSKNYTPDGVYDTAQPVIDFRRVEGSRIESNITKLVSQEYDHSGTGTDSSRLDKLPSGAGKIKYNSFQLSCHDTGWDDLDENVYKANGSLYRFGYWLMFGPWIPIFMAGEEFNNLYSPKEDLVSNGVHPSSMPSNWLYGSRLNWNLLQDPKRKEFFKKCKKIIQIRKNENDIFEKFPDSFEETEINKVKYKCSNVIPTPYIRSNEEKAILIVGNQLKDTGIDVELVIPFENIALSDSEQYQLTDLWTNESKELQKNQLKTFNCHIEADNVGIFKIELP